MPDSPIRRWPFIVAGVFVYAAGAGVGGFFGAAASSLYETGHTHLTALGLWLGIAGGLLAGVMWCRVMLRAAQRYSDGSSGLGMLGWGTIWGIIVGVIATVIVHGGLIIASPLPYSTVIWGLPFGLPFGIGAGAATGLVCASVWLGVASLERRRRGRQSADLDPTK